MSCHLKDVREGIEEAVDWHRRVSAEFGDDYTYWIDFGIDRNKLSNVRRFMRREEADFGVKPRYHQSIPFASIVLGVTEAEGLKLRIARDISWYLVNTRPFDTKEEYEKRVTAVTNPNKEPAILLENAFYAEYSEFLPNRQANVFFTGVRFLNEEDLRAASSAKVTVYLPTTHTQGTWDLRFEVGSTVNLVSDGKRAAITRV